MNRSLRAAAVLAVGLAASCGDAPTEPAALRVAEHARVVLDVAVPLPSLADAELMDAAELDAVMADLDLWLDAAGKRLAAEGASDAELAEVDAARAALRQGARLEAAGDRRAAVALLVDAETRLVRATTRALTASGIAAAAAAETRCDAAGPGAARDEVIVRRGRRLLAHAREAQDEGDFGRAAQRAHYAEMLLAGECPAHTESEE